MNRLGLVLEGGGMRGVYTAGVLDYFLEKNIAVDGVIGVSAGSCHGVSFLSKQYQRNLRVNLNYLDDPDYLSMRNFLKTGSIFGMDMLFNRIPNELDPFDYEAFDRRKAEFVIVSTDIKSGKPHYHVAKDMHADIKYVQASSSLPLLARPVEADGTLLMDGGCSDSIPITYFKERGYTHNIVVLTQHHSYRKGKNNLLPLIKCVYRDYPKLYEALKTRHIRYNQTLDELETLKRQGSVFVIQPSVPVNISRLEKNKQKLQDLYQLGYEDAKKAYPKLVQFLEKNGFSCES